MLTERKPAARAASMMAWVSASGWTRLTACCTACVEVLHAQADAVEALPAQAVHALARHRARIDLDRIFAHLVGRELEAAAQVRHQVAHLRVGQVGRRAAAEVQLLDLVDAGEQRRLHVDFALQVARGRRPPCRGSW